jgi:flagellar basal body-associated protein FliL
MKNIEAAVEPALETIEDYNGKESKEKKMTIWIVILIGLLIGAIYGIVGSNSSVSDALSVDSGIVKY